MDDTLHVGKHWMRLEGDILRCKYVGLISAADVQAFMLRFDKLLSAGQIYYIIADVGAVTGMEAAARRLSTEWFARHDIGGTVNFGAGALTRGISALVLSLLRLLHKNDMLTHFVRTEAEARDWVTAQRQLRAAHSPPR